MGYIDDDRCLDKAFKDEKIFVLLARDATAPLVVVDWIKNNLNHQPREKLIEALKCAIEMARTQKEMYERSHPPVPLHKKVGPKNLGTGRTKVSKGEDEEIE